MRKIFPLFSFVVTIAQEPFGTNNGGGVASPKTQMEMKSDEFAEFLDAILK